MQHHFPLLFLTALSSSLCAQNTTLKNLVNNVSEESLKTNLYKIAGKEFEGRMTASKGDSLAARFIADWFNTCHLDEPLKTTTPYLQDVSVVRSDFSRSSFSVDGKFFELNKQWTYSEGDKNVEQSNVEVVFIGYGISVPDFDELKDIDIEGKLVLVQFDFPTNSNDKSLIPEKEMPDEDQVIRNIFDKKPSGLLIYLPDFDDEMNFLNDFRNFQPYFDFTKEKISSVNGYLLSPVVANDLVGNIDSIDNLISTSGKP
ncbi:MAG: hypothetical protein ACHQF0_13795, partial [Chitinophagales bacterium]